MSKIVKSLEDLIALLKKWQGLSKLFDILNKSLPIMKTVLDKTVAYAHDVQKNQAPNPKFLDANQINALVSTGEQGLQNAYTSLLELQNVHDTAPILFQPAVTVRAPWFSF